MSTTLPPGRRVAGFSTIFWKIHGWDERRAIFRRTCGSGGVVMIPSSRETAATFNLAKKICGRKVIPWSQPAQHPGGRWRIRRSRSPAPSTPAELVRPQAIHAEDQRRAAEGTAADVSDVGRGLALLPIAHRGLDAFLGHGDVLVGRRGPLRHTRGIHGRLLGSPVSLRTRAAAAWPARSAGAGGLPTRASSRAVGRTADECRGPTGTPRTVPGR